MICLEISDLIELNDEILTGGWEDDLQSDDE